MTWPESAVREVAILNEALENAEAEIRRLRSELSERPSQGAIEQAYANAQVRQMHRTGFCPACGAETN